MANISSNTDNYQQIEKLINSSRFNEAFLMLKNRMKNFPALQNEVSRLQAAENTYRYLLDYLFSGHQDPSHHEVMEQIRDSLTRANELLIREIRMVDSSDIYSSTRRLLIHQKTDLQNLLKTFLDSFNVDNPETQENQSGNQISREQASALKEMFHYIWTMAGAPSQEYDELAAALESTDLPDYAKLIIISALVLGGLSYFEPDAYEILLSQYENSESPAIKARAITGVLLLSLFHSSRLQGNMNLRSRLMLTIDDPDLKKIMKEVLLAIVRTYDTQRIDNKMRNEVLPGLMKIRPEIMERLKNISAESEDFLSKENPEWEDILENKEIGDKLQEINDLQLEGADVMVTAFSQLKSFPFFKDISNWFLPFEPGYFEFENLNFERDSETVDRFTTVMCDSDLNSFLLSLKNMPEANRNQLLSNMDSQMKEAREAMSNAIGETPADKLSKKIRHSLQDLYRFFKFFYKKEDFKDPFSSPFLASHLKPLISSLGITAEDIKLVAEFYFQKKYYQEAAGMYELYDTIQPDDFGVWEKIGFCYDKIRRYDDAVKWYQKSEIINPDNPWLIKQLAMALKNSGKPAEALDYYNQALENDTENYHLLMSAAQCQIDLNEPTKALHHLYHAQYLKPEKTAVSRALAWAELMAGDFEKAQNLYTKIITGGKADKTDFLNAGHCAMAASKMKNAIPLYKTFIEMDEHPDIRNLVIAFRDDAEALKKLKIRTEDLRLIVDKIRYDRE